MLDSKCVDLSVLEKHASPFPHFCCPSILKGNVGSELYEWFESTSEWSLTEADFYTQFEFILSDTNLPHNLKNLLSDETINEIQGSLKKEFRVKSLEIVSVVAHKLTNGHTIGIHNDYINGEETHRLVIHVNPFWNMDKGGFLMLFNSPDANDVEKLIQPIHNMAFGFEISDKSYHAVSTIHDFSRYSIVYTFKRN